MVTALDSDLQAKGTYCAQCLRPIESDISLEVKKNEEEERLLIDVLRSAVPGLEGFITGEKHSMISGKMAYNAFGVCYAGGRDDKVRS